MKNWFARIFIVVFIIVLLVILIVTRMNDVRINFITYDRILTALADNDYSIVYFGDLDDTSESRLKWAKSNYTLEVYYSDTTLDDLNTILESAEMSVTELPIYVLFVNDVPTSIIATDANDATFSEVIEKYLYNKIPESERAYKVIDDADEYIDMVKSDEYTVAVFGFEGCSYCNLYIPVFNEVASNYDLDIYYFDRDNYDADEYDKIMDLDLEIPGECMLDGNPSSMLRGFPKPMTFITRSGEIEGCIRGYVTEDVLLDKLKEFDLVED